jgi:hypothetical protein
MPAGSRNIFKMEKFSFGAEKVPDRNLTRVGSRVARWFGFETEIQIWVNFGGPQNGKC